METKGPFDLVCQMAEILDDLGVPYALGGSLASSLLGEPRSTVDVDMAVRLDVASGEALLKRTGSDRQWRDVVGTSAGSVGRLAHGASA